VVIAPPALYLDQCRKQARKEIGVAAQNAYSATSGAYTGEIRCISVTLSYFCVFQSYPDR